MKESRNSLPLYLIPIVVGLAGVLFSSQLEPGVLQTTMILVSVSVPLFVAGFILARLRRSRSERWMLVAGVLMLVLGALVSVSGYAGALFSRESFPEDIGVLSRNIGVGSLVLGLLVTLVTIVRSEEATEALAERFRRLADHMGEGFILTAKDGVVVLVNPAFLRMTGLRQEDVVGRNAMKLILELNAQPMDEHLRRRSKGVASEYEVVWPVRGEDRTFWVSGTPIFDHRNRHTGALATIRDITEMKRMSKRLEEYAEQLQNLVDEQTQKLRESEARLRGLLHTMNEGFLTVDENFRVRFVNERASIMTGRDRDDIVGADVFRLVEPSERSRFRDMFQQTRGRRPGRIQEEFTWRKAKGGTTPVMVSVAGVDDPRERGARYSLVLTDVSELIGMQRELEDRARQLERANEELRAHDRAKDLFLTNVSHELRTPLSTLRGYVEMLSSGSLGESEGPQSGAFSVMMRNIERLENMISEMIDFSRMEIQGIRLNWTLFPLHDWVQERVRSIEPQALLKDVSLTIHVDESLPVVWGDREKLGQVLGILLNNAAKFTKHGGAIQARAESGAGGELVLAVSDTGIGIDSVHHERIFTKFFQVDGSMTRRYGGTGIGLSLAKSIVEAHGGTISVESELGRGSTFEVRLPSAQFGTTPPENVVSGKAVFIGSVDERFADALGQCFEQNGNTVTTFVSAYECARVAVDQDPDWVILDDTLRELSGAQAVIRLREAGWDTEKRTILFVQEDSDTLPGEGLGSAVRTVRKPFTWAKLHAAMAGEAESPIEQKERDAPRVWPLVVAVGEDSDFLEWLKTALALRQINCVVATNTGEGRRMMEETGAEVMLVDADSVDPAAMDALASPGANGNGLAVVIASAEASGNGADQARFPVLRKPFGVSEVKAAVDQAIRAKA